MSQINYNPGYTSSVAGERYAIVDENGFLKVSNTGSEHRHQLVLIIC